MCRGIVTRSIANHVGWFLGLSRRQLGLGSCRLGLEWIDTLRTSIASEIGAVGIHLICTVVPCRSKGFAVGIHLIRAIVPLSDVSVCKRLVLEDLLQ